MKTTIKIIAVAALALATGGCFSNYISRVAVGTPSADDCARFAALGDKAVKAGDKAEVASGAAVAASPLFAPFATGAAALNVVVAGGEKMYQLGVEKYDQKCKGLE